VDRDWAVMTLNSPKDDDDLLAWVEIRPHSETMTGDRFCELLHPRQVKLNP